MKEIKFNPKYKNTLLCNFATPNLYSIILDRYDPNHVKGSPSVTVDDEHKF